MPPKRTKPQESATLDVATDLRESQSRMISVLEEKLKAKDEQLAAKERKICQLSETLTLLHRDYDCLQVSLKQAWKKPTSELMEAVMESESDDEVEGKEKKKPKQTGLCFDSKGHFGPFPDTQYRHMLITAMAMNREEGGTAPMFRMINYPADLMEMQPQGYFVVPWILFHPVKIWGVSWPPCPKCNEKMRATTWAHSGPRIAWTLKGVHLIWAKLYRCGNGKTTGCHKFRGLPPPRVYFVDKCCSFKKLKHFFEYTASEVEEMRAALSTDGLSEASLSEIVDKLNTPTHISQDLMHLLGRMRKACGRLTPEKKAYMAA